MGRFDRAEIEDALQHYDAVVANCSATRDWAPFADLFTEDVDYFEHAYGDLKGREAVREWIVATMAPFPQMRIVQDWVAYDEANDAAVFGVNNILELDGVEYGFPNYSRVIYAGGGLFSSQEDTYNPARDAPRVVGEWVKAGGKLLTKPLAMKYVFTR
ncbi:nuclear transport factor 2 family protein [Antrihabitans cavernicola]|uniref:Nuclear transport factor 2 family protein n=1 Tax=Antrihabitans cavernicola TaxID=2495913 RepID=A0A5A7S8Z1_9NOCA|nr:nuclear transport factor 2 family protein [Spelaeibacter cavernicola]KAA0022600.1 nuclear transport factor 2 family protein [Spelaeibacter cavernicola]